MKFSAAFVILGALIGCSLVSGGPQGRIVGGEDAVLGQLPYQAALSIAGSYNCGAVIIAERFALTALTCVCSDGRDKPWSANLFMVSAGTVDLYNGGQRLKVAEITVNPNYNELKTGVALLRLTEPFIFNDDVAPLPLATELPPLGAYVDISGWGRISATDDNMYRTLQVGLATVEPERACQTAESLLASNDQVLCLGHQRRQGICRGDIGGPAVYQGTLVGLGGEVLGECGGMLPERFVSIAAYYEWIQQKMEE